MTGLAFPLQFLLCLDKIQVITHTHWSINASLQHPRPCRRAGIFGIHEWQVHCLGVELFLNQVQFFIKQLEYFHGFLVNGASDCLKLKQKHTVTHQRHSHEGFQKTFSFTFTVNTKCNPEIYYFTLISV